MGIEACLLIPGPPFWLFGVSVKGGALVFYMTCRWCSRVAECLAVNIDVRYLTDILVCCLELELLPVTVLGLVLFQSTLILMGNLPQPNCQCPCPLSNNWQGLFWKVCIHSWHQNFQLSINSIVMICRRYRMHVVLFDRYTCGLPAYPPTSPKQLLPKVFSGQWGDKPTRWHYDSVICATKRLLNYKCN